MGEIPEPTFFFHHCSRVLAGSRVLRSPPGTMTSGDSVLSRLDLLRGAFRSPNFVSGAIDWFCGPREGDLKAWILLVFDSFVSASVITILSQVSPAGLT